MASRETHLIFKIPTHRQRINPKETSVYPEEDHSTFLIHNQLEEAFVFPSKLIHLRYNHAKRKFKPHLVCSVVWWGTGSSNIVRLCHKITNKYSLASIDQDVLVIRIVFCKIWDKNNKRATAHILKPIYKKATFFCHQIIKNKY